MLDEVQLLKLACIIREMKSSSKCCLSWLVRLDRAWGCVGGQGFIVQYCKMLVLTIQAKRDA